MKSEATAAAAAAPKVVSNTFTHQQDERLLQRKCNGVPSEKVDAKEVVSVEEVVTICCENIYYRWHPFNFAVNIFSRDSNIRQKHRH